MIATEMDKQMASDEVIATMYRRTVKQQNECIARLRSNPQFDFLGTIPLSAVVVKEIPNGLPVVLAHPNTVAAKEYMTIAKQIIERTEE